MNVMTEKLNEIGLAVKLENERLAVSPKRLITKEVQEFIAANRDQIINELKNFNEPLDWRDFCSCGQRLYTARNQWFCPKNCK